MNNEVVDLADVIDVMDEILESGGEFCLHPRCVSLLPLIRQGMDHVILARRTDTPARRNDLAFYRRDKGNSCFIV